MPKFQRYVLGTAALIAWAILWVVSMVANFKFGYSLGTEELEKLLIGSGSVASDFFKAAAPVAFLYFVAKRLRWPAVTALSLSLIAIAYSLIACTGFVASERMAAYDAAKLESMKTQDKKIELDRARTARNWAAKARPVAVVEAEIAAREGDERYRISKGCSRVGSSTREWCREFLALGPELAQAKENIKAESKVEKRREDFYQTNRWSGDYQVRFFTWLTSAEDKTVLLSLMMLAVILIEFGSAFGLGIALALLSPDSTIGRAIRAVVSNRRPIAPEVGGGPDDGPGGGGTVLKAPWPMTAPTSSKLKRREPEKMPEVKKETAAIVRRFRLPPETVEPLRRTA